MDHGHYRHCTQINSVGPQSHFLKAMALGADAVYLGTVAVMAMIHTQMAKTAPMEPPTQLALYSGKLKEELDVELAAKSLTNFLRSCVAEMVLGAVALGKEDLRAINREDLCALTPYAATVTGVAPAYRDRKSTRLNSSHVRISYAVFCLKKKKKKRKNSQH